eukprot:2483990-Alexandrium_andersonii.AAC.1
MLRLQQLAIRRQRPLDLQDWRAVSISTLQQCFADSGAHLGALPSSWSAADLWAVTRVQPHLYA